MKKGAVRSKGVVRRSSKRHIYSGTDKPLMIGVITLVLSLVIVMMFSGYNGASLVTGFAFGIPAPAINPGEVALSQPGDYMGTKDFFIVNNMGQIDVYINTNVPVNSYSFEVRSALSFNDFNPEPYVPVTLDQIVGGVRVSAIIPSGQAGLNGLVKIGTLHFNAVDPAPRGTTVSITSFTASNSNGQAIPFSINKAGGTKKIYIFRGVYTSGNYLNIDSNGDGCVNENDVSIAGIKEMRLDINDLNYYLWDLSKRWGEGCS